METRGLQEKRFGKYGTRLAKETREHFLRKLAISFKIKTV